jgi:hypothetical protein
MPNENNNTTTQTEYFICDVCNDQFVISNRYEGDIENYDNVCNSCLRSTFRYSDRQDLYVHSNNWDYDYHDYPEENDDDYEEDRPESSEYIYGYSSGSFARITPLFKSYENFNNKSLTLGIENEVQVRSSSRLSRGDLAYNITQHDLKNFCECKEDSSIGYGFEIVSKPATFEYHKTAWDIFFQNTAKYLRSYRDNTTGLHIHVNQSYFSKVAVGKILYFINVATNEKFIDDISGRKQTEYCYRKRDVKIKDVLSYRERGAFHIFVSRTKTHEFRCFSGNVKKESFFKTLEFAVALSKYSMTECPINPTYLDFVSFVRSQHFLYPYLFNWLIKRNYLDIKNLKRIKPKRHFYKKGK